MQLEEANGEGEQVNDTWDLKMDKAVEDLEDPEGSELLTAITAIMDEEGWLAGVPVVNSTTKQSPSPPSTDDDRWACSVVMYGMSCGHVIHDAQAMLCRMFQEEYLFDSFVIPYLDVWDMYNLILASTLFCWSARFRVIFTETGEKTAQQEAGRRIPRLHNLEIMGLATFWSMACNAGPMAVAYYLRPLLRAFYESLRTCADVDFGVMLEVAVNSMNGEFGSLIYDHISPQQIVTAIIIRMRNPTDAILAAWRDVGHLLELSDVASVWCHSQGIELLLNHMTAFLTDQHWESMTDVLTCLIEICGSGEQLDFVRQMTALVKPRLLAVLKGVMTCPTTPNPHCWGVITGCTVLMYDLRCVQGPDDVHYCLWIVRNYHRFLDMGNLEFPGELCYSTFRGEVGPNQVFENALRLVTHGGLEVVQQLYHPLKELRQAQQAAGVSPHRATIVRDVLQWIESGTLSPLFLED